jgi:TDG/mug DNA glycosylase family protein
MEKSDRINSFDPIFNSECRILILGSMPGVESLRRRQYYAHPRNRFWRILFELFATAPITDYEGKKAFLLKNNIALWDVVKSCKRSGSLDSNMKDVIANDLDGFLESNPRISHVFFNGKKAFDIFKRKFGLEYPGIEFTRLGSTSPAHAVPFKKLLQEWGVVKDVLYGR